MMATSSRWISLFVILTVTSNISGEDCFNFLCYYANNCERGLNNVTGDCNSCKEGWSGTKCQKQNVALKKKTFVDVPQDSSSNHDIIVDGITKQDKESCIQEYRLNNSIYLDVDFLSSYYIKEVSIFYKEGAVASLRGFSVFIGNEMDVDEGLLCYQHTTEILTDTTTISCNKTGRYLKMKNSRASPPYPADYSVETDLQICEIQAFACARNTFGENCEGLCHCYENDTCDPFTGICPGSNGVTCTQGWVGDSCDLRCENKYGTNCDKQCSQRQCKETSPCNTFDGKCETGCKPGYRGIDCVQECINGYYGDNCNERCDNKGYCNIRTDCNHRTGYCNNGCQPGWTGLKCDSVCNGGSFGTNCQQTCRCYGNDVCNHVTGICPGTGRLKCEEGWSGDRCDQDCAGKYGTNCDKQCSQRQCKETSSCNTFDGKCETGCKPGYREIDCVQECINGYYGENCSERCDNKGYCNIRTDCNHRTGYCNNGCQPGWTGLKCDSVCNTGSFGNNCQQTCRCYGNDVCNHVTGICPGTGRLKCEEGWSGDRCDQDCAGKYGTNCDKQCSQRQCKETSSCNTFDGKCETGCKPGYREIDCVQECSLGNYGEGCSKQCTSNGQYCNEFGCDHITGVCKDGCQSGWLGNSCTEECQLGLYGEKCMFNCSLRNCINMSECNPMDGSCNGNCQDGWSGDDCVQECPINYYGMNCTISCEERNCKVNSTCNNNDGECVGGCLEGFIGLDCLFIEPSADQVVQDDGLDRLYVGLIGVLCGLIFCIIIVVVIYLVCRNKWRRKLLISERRKTKEAIYDDIPDLPPDIAVNNNLYEEPNTETRSGDHMSNRPLPRIVVDSASGSNLVRNKNNQRESRPYVNQTGHYERVDETNNQPINQAQQSTGPENEETNSQSQPEPSPATQPEPSPATQPAVKRDGSPYITMTRGHQVLPTPNSDNTVNSQHADQTLGAGGYAFGINPQDGDTDSISTVDSCCSDKLQQEKNEVRDAAENVMQRKENEYVKMGDMGKNEAKTNPVSSSGNPGEGHVNRNFSE